MNERVAAELLARTLKQYNQIASEFDSTRSQSEDCTALTQYVKPDDLVLDVGCGNGRLTEVLRDRAVHLIGADGSTELIAACRARYAADIENGWVGFTVANALELPFDRKQFDTIFMLAVLHHIPSHALRVQLFTDLHAITKKGGVCVGTTWNLRGSAFRKRYALDQQFVEALHGWDVGDVEIPWKASGEAVMRYCHAFTVDELRAIFAETHWTVVDLYPVTRDFVETDADSGHNFFWVLTA